MISREKQANWYKPLFILGLIVALVKAFAISEPIHIDLNKQAIEDELLKAQQRCLERAQEISREESFKIFEQEMRQKHEEHEERMAELEKAEKDHEANRRYIEEEDRRIREEYRRREQELDLMFGKNVGKNK